MTLFLCADVNVNLPMSASALFPFNASHGQTNKARTNSLSGKGREDRMKTAGVEKGERTG